ncbi:hypothetical protein ACH5RR_003058 [Cinchona calisaya]|uniref:RRM domain-containing protein n=1 Tax=Cinchona calisaya TaxID=153742 RepID=A0ABD3AUE1_9GENT
MAPPNTFIPGAAPISGQVPGTAPATPGQVPGTAPAVPGMVSTILLLKYKQTLFHARRLYVAGLPSTATEKSLKTFFNNAMSRIGGNSAGPGDAVLNVPVIKHGKKYAYLDMRSVEEASNAMALNGINFEGVQLEVKRYIRYNPLDAAPPGPSQPNPNLNVGAVGLTSVSVSGLENPDRIFVGGLPHYLTEQHIKRAARVLWAPS